MSMRREWKLALPLLLTAWALLGWIYRDTVLSMVEIWNRSETFAHAWLVPPISLWLVWRRRGELRAMTPRPSYGWLLALLPLGALWLLGDLAVANAATQFAWVGMLIVLVPAVVGTAVAARVAFALGFLLFAVPFGDFMTPWLMDWTADFTVVALRATGIPVFREGLQFIIPSGAWSVVQACSGIRYLMASVMVGTLFAYLNYASNAKRWVFVLVAVLTPLVANWLRAYIIVMLGHLSGNRLAVGVDHVIYGWVFFGIVMLAMFMIGARWADAEPAAPSVRGAPSWTQAATGTWLGVALLAAGLLVLPQGLRLQALAAGDKGVPQLSAPVVPGWTWNSEPLSSWQPAFAGPSAVLHGHLSNPEGADVGLYVGYYRHQRPGSQLVTSVNRLVDDEVEKVWAVTATGMAQQGQDGSGPRWRTADLRGQALSQVSGGGGLAPRLRAWSVYWINGHLTTSDWKAKLLGAWEQLQGHGDDAAIVIIYMDKAAAGEGDSALRGFLQRHWSSIDTDLRGARDRRIRAEQ